MRKINLKKPSKKKIPAKKKFIKKSVKRLCIRKKPLLEDIIKALEKEEDSYIFPHTWTQDLLCPYCGHNNSDSWKNGNDSGEQECANCGEIYSFDEFMFCSDYRIANE